MSKPQDLEGKDPQEGADEVTTTPTEPDETDSVEPEADQPDDADEEGGKDERENDLPDWAREKLTRANSQAANYRTQLRDAEARYRDLEARFEGAKTLDEFNAAVKELTEAKEQNAALVRENVAKAHGLPDDLAELLKGETREDLEAHAKKLAKYVPVERIEPELSGGLDPQVEPDENLSPGELALKHRRWR